MAIDCHKPRFMGADESLADHHVGPLPGSPVWPLHSPVKSTVAKLLRMEMGNTSSIKWFDGVGEYIIDRGPG